MKSITVRVIGGLGNQMHCYAFGRALAAHNGRRLDLDTESGYWNDPFDRVYLLNQFSGLNISHKEAKQKTVWQKQLFRLGMKLKSSCSKFLPLGLRPVVMEEPPYCYKYEIHHARYMTNPYFVGYWASYRYYQEIEKELRQELRPPLPNHPAVQALLSQIKAVRSCFIHWRSYNEDNSSAYTDLSGYYREAVRLVAGKYSDIVFFVFSDDPGRAKEQVAVANKKMIYVDLPDAKGNLQSLADFYLMFACDHAIIGNSSFSWWAAWLSDHEKKTVIAPGGLSPWGDDWAPSQWVSLDYKNSKEWPCRIR